MNGAIYQGRNHEAIMSVALSDFFFMTAPSFVPTARDISHWNSTNDWRGVERGGGLVLLPVGFMEQVNW